MNQTATQVATLLAHRSPDLVVVASPTYEATYSGLLKVFLDRFPAGLAAVGPGVSRLLRADDRSLA